MNDSLSVTDRTDTTAERAVELLMADVHRFTYWLHCKCENSPRVDLGYVDCMPHRLMSRCDTAPIQELVALAAYPNKDAQHAAMDEIGKRFVAAHLTDLAELQAELMAGV